MTLVVGQQFFQGIVMIADSRASVLGGGKIIPWRDNTQKIFRLQEHLFIGFAGDIEFAGSIIAFLIKQINERRKLGQLHLFYSKAPKLIKYAYKVLSDKFGEKRLVSFMVGGVDFRRPAPVKDSRGKVTSYLSIYDKKLFKLESPEFEMQASSIPNNPILIMGSGEPALVGLERDFEKLQFGINPSLPLSFHASLIGMTLRNKAKKLGIDTVGGLFQIMTIDNNGSRFLGYKSRSNFEIGEEEKNDELDVELIVKNGRLIQKNLISGKESLLLWPPEVLEIKDPSTDLFADIDGGI